jgi:hypothetical protein
VEAYKGLIRGLREAWEGSVHVPRAQIL